MLKLTEYRLEKGAIVRFFSRTAAEVNAAVRLLNEKFDGSRAVGFTVDVSKAEDVEGWVGDVLRAGGSIDAVVNNVSSISVTDEMQSWKKAYETDMLGTVSVIQAALPHLVASEGNIVTIRSVSGRDVDFTAPSPANIVGPGNVYIEDGVWGGVEKNNPELFKSQMSKNPMGRMGKACEIADAVLFLASQRASFVSGTNLVFYGSLYTGVQF